MYIYVDIYIYIYIYVYIYIYIYICVYIYMYICKLMEIIRRSPREGRSLGAKGFRAD